MAFLSATRVRTQVSNPSPVPSFVVSNARIQNAFYRMQLGRRIGISLSARGSLQARRPRNELGHPQLAPLRHARIIPLQSRNT